MSVEKELVEIEKRAKQAVEDDWNRGLPTSFLEDNVKDDLPRVIAALRFAVVRLTKDVLDGEEPDALALLVIARLLRGEPVKA